MPLRKALRWSAATLITPVLMVGTVHAMYFLSFIDAPDCLVFVALIVGIGALLCIPLILLQTLVLWFEVIVGWHRRRDR